MFKQAVLTMLAVIIGVGVTVSVLSCAQAPESTNTFTLKGAGS